jgi:putative ABC transport system permease protein
MALAGIVVGVAIAWTLSGVMSGMLYGVSPQDPTTFLTVPALLMTAALLASWLPALRATRVRPAAALRWD